MVRNHLELLVNLVCYCVFGSSDIAYTFSFSLLVTCLLTVSNLITQDSVLSTKM